VCAIGSTGAMLTAALLAGTVLILHGCGTLQGFNTQLTTAYTGVDTVVQTDQILVQSQKISKADAQNILNQATNVKEALDLAQAAHAADANTGGDKLQSAITALAALQTYLQSKEPQK